MLGKMLSMGAKKGIRLIRGGINQKRTYGSMTANPNAFKGVESANVVKNIRTAPPVAPSVKPPKRNKK